MPSQLIEFPVLDSTTKNPLYQVAVIQERKRKMSTYTVATLPRISGSKLSQLLLSQSLNPDAAAAPSSIAIIDVRDEDHIGGHIRSSIHAPSRTLDYKTPELVRKLKDKEIVVFHCALSQQRGPSAALRYLRERDRLLGSSTLKLGGGEQDGTPEGQGERDEDGEKGQQRVYVLKGGFVEWQESFGEDERLTEGYSKELWKEGYWM